MDAVTSSGKSKNLALTQLNSNLRNQIASLRKDRLDLQYKLVEAIGAKESFKIEVIKLITQTQNTFERLKTFIEHTTTTPPPPMLSGMEKLLRRQIVGGGNVQQQQQPQTQSQSQREHHREQEGGGIARQLSIVKQMVPLGEPGAQPQTTTAPKEEVDMQYIDKKILRLNTILKKYKSEVENDQQAKDELKHRRYSKRLQSTAIATGKQKDAGDDNPRQRSALKDINHNTRGESLSLRAEKHSSAPPPGDTSGSGRKRRKILV